MIFDTLRIYEAGSFHDVDLPDWYRQAERLCEQEHLDWHRALDRVLDCEDVPLTGEGSSGWITARFWASASKGTYVLIETEYGWVEHVLIVNPTDWLPFLATCITPIIAATAQTAAADTQRIFTNAFIAWARHGEGTHVDRYSGLSRIDRDNDEMQTKALAFRAALARKIKENPT